MKILKESIIPLLCLIGFYYSNWVFNHVNAWVGIICYIITGSITIEYLYKQTKR